jgi:N-acetylneuraminic acid mutarotase
MNINVNTSNEYDDKYMPLDERDTKLVQIENAKQKTRAVLLDKYYAIGKKSTQNKFLGGVAKKYGEFYNDIMKQREDQIRALKTLYQHIEDMKQTDIGENKKELEREQKIISREINEIENLVKEHWREY